MSWGAVAVGGAGLVAGAIGSKNASDAAGSAANAQQAAAQQMRGDILGFSSSYRDRSDMLSQASPQELSALSRQYDAADQSLSRQEKLMSSIDPSIMEASKQALALLQGKTADINKPMMDLRNSQRQSLLSSLRSQYGPGAENSSIGQKALQSFDMQSNQMFAQNQQNALGTTFGMANMNTQIPMQQAIQGLGGVGAGYGALQQRRLGAFENSAGATMNALAGSSSPVINAAGAGFVGQGMQGAGLASLGSGMAQTGMMMGMAGAFRGGGASSPQVPSDYNSNSMAIT